MRWKYPDPKDREESVAREAVIRKMDRWWEEFARRAGDLDLYFRKSKAMDVPGFMEEHLQSIDPRLMWEFGPGPNGSGHRLVITPEHDFQLRPMTDHLVDRAPKLDGWTFIRYRPRESVQGAEGAVQGRSGGTLKDVLVSCRIGDHARIDVTYHFPGGSTGSEKELWQTAFVATETLLGEELLDKWVGSIDVASLPKQGWLAKGIGIKPKQPLGLVRPGELGSLFDEVMATVIDQSRQPPWKSDVDEYGKEQYSLIKLSRSSEAADAGQSDVFSAAVSRSSVYAAIQSGAPFFSCRFARPPATFCYVKVDGAGIPSGGEVAFRAQWEDALADVLREKKAGGVIGGGTGRGYCYIELILATPGESMSLVRETLRLRNAPPRTWVLFHDEYLSSEWVAVWDESPPPPADKHGRVSGCFKDL